MVKITGANVNEKVQGVKHHGESAANDGEQGEGGQKAQPSRVVKGCGDPCPRRGGVVGLIDAVNQVQLPLKEGEKKWVKVVGELLWLAHGNGPFAQVEWGPFVFISIVQWWASTPF